MTTNDAEGYPTEEALAYIAGFADHARFAELLDFVKAAWHWPEFARHDLWPNEAVVVNAEPGEKFLRLATGGWSGNESLIAALAENRPFFVICWRLSAAGGLHIYRYPLVVEASTRPTI